MTQDKKYTKSEFISSIRSEYPQYSNIDDETLYTKILDKYPVYKNQITEEGEVLKKKEEPTPSQEESLDFTSAQDSSDIKKKVFEEEYDKGDYEFDDRFSAGANEVMASISRIPAFITEQVATVIGAFDSDFKDQLNSMTREQRDAFLGSMPMTPGGGSMGGMTKVSEEYSKEAEKIRSSFDKFDTSITEDIAAGDLGQATGRLFNEAVGAIPSMIQAFVPGVGIASIGLGSAAQKSKELQDRGYDLGLKTSANSIISGTAEGLSDLVTKKIGGRFFDSLAGKGKDYVVKSVGNFAKSFGIDFAEEGASETISLLVSKLADYRISGDKEAFNNTLYEFTDTFLVGGFATGPLSGGKIGIDVVRQNSRKRAVNKKVKDSKYKSISDAFSSNNMDEIDSDQTNITKSKGAKEILKFELDEKVNQKVITREDADSRLKSFEEVSALAKETEGLDLTSEKEQQATNLIREKRKLEKTIEGKDENLVTPQKNRIEEINEELSKVQEEEVVEEVTQPETTEEAVKEELVKPELEQKLTYQTSNQTQVTVDESGKFQEAVDLKTGKKRTKETARKAQNELIAQRDYTTGKSAFEGKQEGEVQEAEVSDLIASESENAQEIAQEYQKKKEEGLTLDPVIEAFVGKYKVSSKSIKRYYGGKDDLPKILGYLKGRKGQKATPLDKIALEVSEVSGVEVSPEQLFSIMMDPKYKSNTKPKEADIVTELRNRFIEVTGFDGTDSQIDAIANQDPSKLKPVKEPIEVAEEQAEVKEQAEVEEAIQQREEVAKDEKLKVEEEVSKSKTKGIVGRVIDGFAKIKKQLQKKTKKHLTAQGLQPDIIYKEREKRDSNIRMYQNRIERTMKQVRSALKTVPKEQRDATMKEFDRLFRGEIDKKNAALSIELIAAAETMRAQVDGLSTMLMESGYFDNSKGIQAIQDNIGKYVNRSYRLFSDPNWASKVSEEVKDNARKLFRKQAAIRSRQIQSKINKLSQENIDKSNDNKIADLKKELEKVTSEQMIEQQINEILNKAEDNKFIVRGKDGRIDKDILKRRKDIPAEVRALMGEVTNPLQNYQNTVLKQAMLVFNYKFQRKIAEAGKSTFFTDGPTKENTVQIVKEGNEAYPELAGLWTRPEIAETFKKKDPIGGWVDKFTKLSGAIKWGKTVGSIATHAKNIIGNHGFVLMNGHLDWNEFKKAGDLAWSEFTGKTTKEQQEYLDELISLGIVKQSATLGDIKTIFTDKSFEEAYDRAIIDQSRNVAKGKESAAEFFRSTKAGKAVKRVVDKMNDAYQSEDDFFKIMAYGIEKNRHAEAMYGKSFENLTKQEAKKVNEIVAEKVKNTYPTYDRVPPIIKRLGRSPILGAFVSFRAESVRTAWNTFIIAKEELNSSNPGIRKIGAKRMGSFTVYTGLKLGLAAQLGLAAKSLITGGEDDESQEYNDLKRFLPEWSQDSVISIISKEPGKYRYIDMTANDPHAFLSELIVAGSNEDDLLKILAEKVKTIYEPFLGKDLLFSFVSEVLANQKSSGASVYENADNLIDKGHSVIQHAVKLLEPGTISTMKRISNAATDEDKSLLGEFVGAFTGYRPVDSDVKLSYTFRVRSLRSEVSDQVKKYNRARYNEKSTKEEISETYEQVNKSYSDLIKQASDYTMSAIRLGVDSNEISSVLKKQGFSKRDISYIFSGLDYVYVPSKMRK